MTEQQQLKEFHKACQNIVDNAELEILNYAVNYAKHGLTIDNMHEAKVQAMYIISNITHWRGDSAKETRTTLKRISK